MVYAFDALMRLNKTVARTPESYLIKRLPRIQKNKYVPSCNELHASLQQINGWKEKDINSSNYDIPFSDRLNLDENTRLNSQSDVNKMHNI